MKNTVAASSRYILLILCLVLSNWTLGQPIPPIINVEVRGPTETSGPETVCEESVYTYKMGNLLAGGYTYQWQVLGAPSSAYTFVTPSSMPTTNIKWNAPGGPYMLIGTEYGSGGGFYGDDTLIINIYEQPALTMATNFRVACIAPGTDSSAGGVDLGPGHDPRPPVIIDDSLRILEDENGCHKVCQGKLIYYYGFSTVSAPLSASHTATWTLSPGGHIDAVATAAIGGGFGVAVVWDTLGPGSITLTEDNNSCIDIKTICVDVIEKPNALFLSLPDVGQTPGVNAMQACVNTPVSFLDLSTASPGSPIVSWYWKFGDGTSSGLRNPVHTYTADGDYNVDLIVTNQCGCTDTFTWLIQVNPDQGPEINCSSVTCENNELVYYTPTCVSGYTWSVQGGTITVNNGVNITVKWDYVDPGGFGYVNLLTNCSACPATTTLKVPVVNTHPDIKMPNKFCAHTRYEISLPLWPGTRYDWGVIGYPQTIVGDKNSNKVVVTLPPGDFKLHATWKNGLAICGGDTVINIHVDDVDPILGATVICKNFSYAETYTTNTGALADWKLLKPNGTYDYLAASTSYSYIFDQKGVYYLYANGTFCSPPLKIVVNELDIPLGDIFGDTLVCAGMPYNYYAPVINGTSVSYGAVNGTYNISNNGLSVVWNSFPGYLIAYRVSDVYPFCVGALDTVIVYENVPLPDISGPDTICANSLQFYYSNYKGAGATYTWEIVSYLAGSIFENSNVGVGPYTRNMGFLSNNTLTPVSALLISEIKQCNIVARDTMEIVILPRIPTVIKADTITCSGKEVEFKVTKGAYTYSWFVDDLFIASGAADSFTHTFWNATGSEVYHTIKVVPAGVRDTLQCIPSDTATFVIRVNSGPVIDMDVHGDTFYCSGTAMITILVANATGASPFTYQWYDKHLPLAGETGDTYVPSNAGYYYTIVEDDNGCISYSDTVIMDVRACYGVNGCLDTVTFDLSGGCGRISAAGSLPGTNPFWSMGPIPSWNLPNTRNGVLTSGQNTENATFYFSDPGDFVIRYSKSFGDDCRPIDEQYVHVPLVPSYRFETGCDPSGTGYVHRLINSSRFLGNYMSSSATPTFSSASFEIRSATTGALIVQDDITSTVGDYFPLSGGRYALAFHVGMTDPAYTPDTVYPNLCHIIDTFEVPEWPILNIKTFSPDIICEGLPVSFEIDYLSGSGWVLNKPKWDFGDGSAMLLTATQREYTFSTANPFNPNIYTPIFTCGDVFGCLHTIFPGDVTIYQNIIRGNVTGATQVCNGPVTLDYSPTTGTAVTFLWSDAAFIGWQPTSPHNVDYSGAYYVTAEDAHQCRVVTDQVGVEIFGATTAFIEGKSDFCEEMPVELNCSQGPGPTYDWYMDDGTGYSYKTSGGTISYTGLPPGTYHWKVVIGTSTTAGICYDTTEPDTIVVHPIPAPPAISSIAILDCDLYEVEITAAVAPGGTQNYNWSNGTFGATTTVYEGGIYRLWYTDQWGCTSYADTTVPTSVQTLVDGWFPAGCYRLCTDALPVDLYGPPGLFWNWEWTNNIVGTIRSGINSAVDPITITTGADYTFQLQNQFCTANSKVMSLTTYNCSIYCSNIFIDYNYIDCIDTIPNAYAVGIQLNNTDPNPLDLSLGLSNGGITPFTFTVPNGIVNLDLRMVVMGAPPMDLELKYLFAGNPDYCYQKINFNPPYPCGNWQNQRQYQPQQNGDHMQQGPQNMITSAMMLYPNPATNTVNVQYDYGRKDNKMLMLQVYDVAGRLQANIPLREQSGSQIVDVRNWAPGLYMVRMLEDGKAIHTQRVSVMH